MTALAALLAALAGVAVGWALARRRAGLPLATGVGPHLLPEPALEWLRRSYDALGVWVAELDPQEEGPHAERIVDAERLSVSQVVAVDRRLERARDQEQSGAERMDSGMLVFHAAAGTAVGLLLHRLAIDPAKDASAVTLIIITIGASILLRGVAGVGLDKNFHSLPPFIGAEPWNIGGAAVLPQSVLVLLGTGVIVLLLWLFMSRTLTGKAMIATAAVPPRTQKLCDWTDAPSTSIGASPENDGSLWNCLSNRICAAPRSRIEAPMVMMIKVTAGAPRAGSIASQYSRSPTATAATTAMSAASGSGTPAAATNTVTMPPSMTNSPCAKFTTSEAL